MCNVESNTRQAIEKRIAKSTIADLLAAGFTLSVNDGEEETLTYCTDPAAILAAMFTTDEDYLLTNLPGEPFGNSGFVRFIYGNDGWDVINDYSTSLEDALTATNALADRIGEDGYAAVLEEENAASAAKLDAVRTHVDAWIGLLAAHVESLPPDTAPTPENPAGQCSRSYAEHELRAMRRDLPALFEGG